MLLHEDNNYEEANDIATLKLDKLFGSLHTFEQTFDEKNDKKGKGLAFECVEDEEPY